MTRTDALLHGAVVLRTEAAEDALLWLQSIGRGWFESAVSFARHAEKHADASLELHAAWLEERDRERPSPRKRRRAA